MDKLCRGPYRISSILKWVTEKNETKRLIKKKNNDCFWMEIIFCLESHIHLCHVTQAQILPTSSKHVSLGMQFLGLGIGGLSHQSYMSLHIGTNNFVGGSISLVCFANIHPWPQVMPIFDQEMPPGFTPAICLHCNFVYISNLENRGDKSLDQNF